MLGIGAMLGQLGGNEETVNALKGAIGKAISAVSLENDSLNLHFADGSGIRAYDDGQSCCENRFMTCSDTLEQFVGATLLGMELAEAPDGESEYGEPHEVQFLRVNTSKGTITAETHNEHNGYYGGFHVVIRVL